MKQKPLTIHKCVYCSKLIKVDRKNQKLVPHLHGAKKCIGAMMPLKLHVELFKYQQEKIK